MIRPLLRAVLTEKIRNRTPSRVVLHTDWPDWGVFLLSSDAALLQFNYQQRRKMQMVKLRKVTGVIALAGTLLLMGIVGFAQETSTQDQGQGKQERGERGWHRKGGEGRGMRGGEGRGGFGHFGENLNLTDAQKEQMKQIATRYHESFKANRPQGRENRGGGFDAFNGGTFNEAAVRAAAQARANARVEMEVTRARMMSEMYNVLTAEQKAQLAAERQQWQQNRQERRAGRKANPGQIQ
jgi:Spy/CpxP family protein refolding chaperone